MESLKNKKASRRTSDAQSNWAFQQFLHSCSNCSRATNVLFLDFLFYMSDAIASYSNPRYQKHRWNNSEQFKCVEIPTEVQILDWTSIFEFSINIVQKIEYNLKHLAA